MRTAVLHAALFVFLVPAALAQPEVNVVNPTPESIFIGNVIKDVLFVAPEKGEIELARLLTQGSSREVIARGYINTNEFRTSLVNGIYLDYLGRDADAGSLAAYLNLLDTGGSSESIRIDVLSSDEYFNDVGGGTNQGFVTELFDDLLNRPPSTPELTASVNFLLAGNPRRALVEDFVMDDTRRAKATEALFMNYLGREPTRTELTRIVADWDSGEDDEDVRVQILGSDEYFRKDSPLVKGLTTSGLVATFTDDPGFGPGSYINQISFGDGTVGSGSILSAGDGQFGIYAFNQYNKSGKFQIRVNVIGPTGRDSDRGTIRIGKRNLDIQPYSSRFRGGVHVAVGDVNGDSYVDIITGAGPGAGPEVKVFSGLNGSLLRSFFAYDPGFRGGVFVAAGDFDGDSKAEIVTGAGPGGGPHVKMFSGADNSIFRSFFAYAPDFRGGVTVAVGDVNGTSIPDIITGAGPGGGPHVQAFSGLDSSLLKSFFAYDSGFSGGVFVAAGDVNGDGRGDIITGAGPGGGAHVIAFSGLDDSTLASFIAYDGFAGGVRVAAADVNGDGSADVITGAGPGGGPHVKVFSGVDQSILESFFAFAPTFSKGVFVAAGDLDGDGSVRLVSGTGEGAKTQVKVQPG